MNKKNKPYFSGSPWTKAEDSDLRQWYKQGHTNRLIADWLDRPVSGVEYRIAKLGLKGKVAKIAKAAKAKAKASKTPVAGPVTVAEPNNGWDKFNELPDGSKLTIVKRGFEALVTFTRGAKQYVIGWLRRF